MTPRNPRDCTGCGETRSDVFSRQIGDTYYHLCPPCADRRRACNPQRWATQPAGELPRVVRQRPTGGDASGD